MKLIFELAVQDANLASTLKKLREDLAAINKELSTTTDADKLAKLNQEALETKFAISEVIKAQKLLQKEFAETQLPVGSLAALRLEYQRLVSQISYLSEAERNSEIGKETIKNAKDLKDRINEIENSVGNFTGSVGNYKDGILSAAEVLGRFGGTIGQQADLLNQAAGIFEATSQAGGKFVNFVKSGSESVKESIASFKQYIADLKTSKKAADEAAKAQEDIGEAAEQTADASEAAGKGLAESAKGAGLLSRAGGVLKNVLSGLGIGLIITFIVGLISVFQRFAPVVDFTEQVIAGLSAAFDALVSRVAKVVSAFGKFFTGDFSGAFKDTKEAVSGVGEAMVGAALAAAQLKKEMQDLEDAQKDFELTTARTEAAIAKLSISLRDKTRSDQERLKIAGDITKLERDNLAEKTSLIDKEIDIEKRRLLLSGFVTKQQADQIAAGNFELARQLEDQFVLQADQAERIRVLLIERTKVEGESATLLERVETRRSAILEAAAERQKNAREKTRAAAEKAQKDIEAQIARIRDLEKSVRDLDAETITNDFDRQSIEIENKRKEALEKVAAARDVLTKKIAEQKSVLTEADKKELALISEQTASIKAAYDLQQKEVEENRQKAIAAQLQELATLSVELTNLAQQNTVALARAESEIVNTGFAKKQAELEAILVERKRALSEQLEAGTISQKKFKDEYLKAQEAFNIGSLQLERQRADETATINANLEKARIEAAKAALNVRLEAIRAETAAEIDAATERATSEGGDAGATIDALKLRAIEQRKQAEQEYNDAVRAAQNETLNSQLAATEAISAADQKVHDEKLARIKEEKEKRKELQQQLLDAASTVAGAVFEIERNRIAKQENQAIESLDAEFEKRREAAAGNADQLAKIDAEYQKRKEAIEKQAAEKRKRTAIVEAVIQGALAVVKSLPNLVLAALTAVTTAAQIAVINSQSFALGGMAKLKRGVFGGRHHSQGGTKGVFDDGTEIEVEKDEVFVILNRRASNEIRKLSDFNARHGGRRFADGGALDFTPQFRSLVDGSSGGSIVVVAEFTDEQIDVFANRIAGRTGSETRKAVVAGLDDRNRTAERQTVMDANREI